MVEAPGTGALAAPSGALSSPAGELAALGATSGILVEAPVIHSFGSPAWEATLLAAVNPADFESLDLSGVRHLYSRLRGSPGGWFLVVGYLPDSAGHCGVYFWHESNWVCSAVLQ